MWGMLQKFPNDSLHIQLIYIAVDFDANLC